MPPTLRTCTRRSVLKSACGLTSLAAFPHILAADGSHPKVWLDMTQEELDAAYSQLIAPVMVTYSSLESPEFQRQSRDFAKELRKQDKQVDLLVAKDYNHFEILETLANPYGLLGNAALSQLNLI